MSRLVTMPTSVPPSTTGTPEMLRARVRRSTSPATCVLAAAGAATATVASVYAQDQIEFTPHWQAIVGLRYDRFKVEDRDRHRIDDRVLRRYNP